ncbi:hypothetical protein POM88_051897 [Heracleum sosnowskyi]|uniref:F-box domain-containing protein n=1 Tax=Heracleum sosnowskyi TaxID=360622 RepID=A0AAD8GSG5_9APIA|nr:hypothetical protein POM88_051897 [Heracleum sosnowskyi]
MGDCSSLDKENVFDLPEEILAEILSWLEAKYLLRCECVCKVWCSVIRSKLLVDMHALLLYNQVKQKYDLALLDLGGQSDDPCPNADLSWRIVKIPVFDMLSRQDRQERYHFSYCMSREGILHILTSPRVGLQNPKVMCVDLVKQTCGILKVPQNLYFNCKELKFQSWTHKPSILFVRDQKLNIWVLEDYKKQKWADTMVVPLPFLEQRPSLMTELVPHIHRDNDDEEDILVYIHGPGNPRLYTVKSGSVCSGPTPLMRIPATLVSLRGMQPKKKDC